MTDNNLTDNEENENDLISETSYRPAEINNDLWNFSLFSRNNRDSDDSDSDIDHDEVSSIESEDNNSIDCDYDSSIMLAINNDDVCVFKSFVKLGLNQSRFYQTKYYGAISSKKAINVLKYYHEHLHFNNNKITNDILLTFINNADDIILDYLFTKIHIDKSKFKAHFSISVKNNNTKFISWAIKKKIVTSEDVSRINYLMTNYETFECLFSCMNNNINLNLNKLSYNKDCLKILTHIEKTCDLSYDKYVEAINKFSDNGQYSLVVIKFLRETIGIAKKYFINSVELIDSIFRESSNNMELIKYFIDELKLTKDNITYVGFLYLVCNYDVKTSFKMFNIKKRDITKERLKSVLFNACLKKFKYIISRYDFSKQYLLDNDIIKDIDYSNTNILQTINYFYDDLCFSLDEILGNKNRLIYELCANGNFGSLVHMMVKFNLKKDILLNVTEYNWTELCDTCFENLRSNNDQFITCEDCKYIHRTKTMMINIPLLILIININESNYDYIIRNLKIKKDDFTYDMIKTLFLLEFQVLMDLHKILPFDKNIFSLNNNELLTDSIVNSKMDRFLFLAKTIKLTNYTYDNNTLLKTLCLGGNLNNIRMFVETTGIKVNDVRMVLGDIINILCTRGYLNILNYLYLTFNLTQRDFSSISSETLVTVISCNNLELVSFLIDTVNVDIDLSNPIILNYIQYGRTEIMYDNIEMPVNGELFYTPEKRVTEQHLKSQKVNNDHEFECGICCEYVDDDIKYMPLCCRKYNKSICKLCALRSINVQEAKCPFCRAEYK